MPFVKSNWACTPTLEDGGYFEYGLDFELTNLTLKRAEQSRPCFVHVSSEVECIVRVLTVVASVEILDVYALVGPLDSFDYRHVSKIHGLPTDPSSTRYIFTIDPNVIPREKVWQLQLKLSSSAQGLMTIQVDELTVQVDRANGLADFDRTGKSVGNASELSVSQSTRGAFFASNRSNMSTSIGRSTHRGLSTTLESFSETGGGGLGGSVSRKNASLSSPRLDASQAGYATGRSNMSLSTSRLANTMASTTLSESKTQAAPTTSRSARLAASGGGGGLGRSIGGGPGDLGVSTSTSVARQAAMTGELTLRGRSGGNGSGGELATMQAGGNQTLGFKEETAAVASVLNAVCEKMVGVVSEKTKAYLAKAGKRTERRVLDKMAKLEERIEKFDQVLDHATVSSKEIEQALLDLDKDLLSSPHVSIISPMQTPSTS